MSKQSKQAEKAAMAAAAGAFGGPVASAITSSLNQGPRKPTKVGGVRRQGETRAGMQQRLGSDNSDIEALFKGLRENRGMVRRDLSGNIADPNKPTGLNALYAMNPHLQTAGQRQQGIDAQLGFSQAAQNSAMRAQDQQTGNPNLVTGNDGYRTLFGNKGEVIGTTKPMESSANWMQDKAINSGTATNAERQDFSSQLQNTGRQSAASKAPPGMDQIFGNSSPSGGGQTSLVGAGGPQGAPGGDFPPLPAWATQAGKMGANAGPQRPDSFLPMRQNDGPQQPGMRFNDGPQLPRSMPNDGPQLPRMGQNDGPQIPNGPQLPQMGFNQGPQLQYNSPDQIAALRKMSQLFGTQSPSSAGLESTWTNMFPGKDWDYLSQLFPGVLQQPSGISTGISRFMPNVHQMKNLQQIYQNPAYQSQF